MRIALVTPWFGRELIGGAERHAWELAHALAGAEVEVDVLTTCCRSFHDDWSTNFHRAGTTVLGSRLRLLRYRVDSRDRVAFGRVSAALTALPEITLRGDYVPLDERGARTFVSENINSRALQAALLEGIDAYDAVLFMPYLYGTTLTIAPQVADKAFIVPCLHDEAYAYVEPVRSLFARVRGLLFNSLGEQETAAAIHGPGIYGKSRVVGEAVEPVAPPRETVTVKGFTPQRSRYVLYLGRQVATKNIDFLIDAYRMFRRRRAATSLQLVLAGPTSTSRSDDGIVDLGPVDESVKAGLLTYARALAQPSVHESFSRAIYESWYARRPVFVHGRCRATARAVEESGGGWIGSTVDDWSRMFAELDESADDTVDAVGERGWAAALDNGTWASVAQRIIAAVTPKRVASPVVLDQVVPLGARAASEYATALGEALTEAGADAQVAIAGTATRSSSTLIHLAGDDEPQPGTAYVAHAGEVAIPPRAGLVFAATREVAIRLDERGIASRLLPLPVSPRGWDGVRPAHRRWADGDATLLSIADLDGESARRLLDVFVAFLGGLNRARLLVFERNCDEEARRVLESERAELDLRDAVHLVGDAIGERYAAYRAAHVALAVGRPLDTAAAVTTLWFDVPIVALDDPVALEVVESCGLLEDRFDASRLAALARIVASDEALRTAIAAEARRTRERHAPPVVAAALLEALAANAAAAHPGGRSVAP